MPNKTVDPLSVAQGYREDFLGPDLRVPLPKLASDLQQSVAPVQGNPNGILHYHNYSVVQHATRRFPFFTASNIDGQEFVDLNRKDIFPGGRDRWRKDPRLEGQFQWGQELYSAPKSNFDRGHMTRREDVQWGRDSEEARLAAQTTFYFTNSVPQHPDLNRAIWSNLEDYILHQEAVGLHLRINLFTGPALRDDDPLFITPVNGEKMQLPIYFWKVVYFSLGNSLMHVGFLIGQNDLLNRDGIVEPAPASRSLLAPSLPEELHFIDFKEADTYQVKVSVIERLTGLRFPRAKDPIRRRRQSIKLTLEQVEAPDGARGGLLDGSPQVAIKGLVLG